METDNRTATIQHLTDLKKQLMERRERLLRPVLEVERQLQGVVSTLALVLEGVKAGDEHSPRAALLRKLKGLTQPQALFEIASYNGGTLNAQEAKALMVHAGILRETKNAASVVHKVISRTDKFVRIGRGKYRFKTVGESTPPAEQELLHPLMTDTKTKPVQ